MAFKFSVMDEPLKRFLEFYKERIEEAQADSKLAHKIVSDFNAKLPDIHNYFCEFLPVSVEEMLRSYGIRRHRFTKASNYYAKRTEEIQLGYIPEAEKFLKQILFKKLFDLQGLWRAGKKQIKGIDVTYDFRTWFLDIFNCPFLPPITQDEVDLMIRFLKETPVELHHGENGFDDYDWDNYPYQKMTYAEREGIELQEFYQTYALAMISDMGYPPWYDFYDNYMGTAGILMMTDVKFPKELYYIRLLKKHKDKEEELKKIAEGKSSEVQPVRPVRLEYLGADSDFTTEQAIDEFVEEFETPENKRLWKAYKLVDNYGEKYDEALLEEVESVIYELKSIGEKVPIEEHEDWRQGLIISFRKYKYRKTIETIPMAYSDYLMRLETGVGFAHPENTGKDSTIDNLKQQILEGRRLNGEPMDFNY